MQKNKKTKIISISLATIIALMSNGIALKKSNAENLAIVNYENMYTEPDHVIHETSEKTEALYIWYNDCKNCDAVLVDKDGKEILREEAIVTTQNLIEGNCVTAEITTYIARFNNNVFNTQTQNKKTSDPTDHIFTEWEVIKENTCTESGMMKRSCKRNDLDQFMKIPASHKIITIEKSNPTCTKSGYTESSYCENCNETIKEREEIPALGHQLIIDPEIPATDYTNGLTSGMHCERCNEIIKAQEIIPAAHYDTNMIHLQAKLLFNYKKILEEKNYTDNNYYQQIVNALNVYLDYYNNQVEEQYKISLNEIIKVLNDKELLNEINNEEIYNLFKIEEQKYLLETKEHIKDSNYNIKIEEIIDDLNQIKLIK